MPFFERPNAKIYYELEGTVLAPCVTLLNGFSRSSTDFKSLARLLVNNGWRVLRIDNRGAGKTENASDFSISEMVDDVVALWDHLEIPKSHLLGISYGGVLALLLANQNTQRISSLILVSTTPSSFFLKLDNDLPAQEPGEVEETLTHYFSERFTRENPILYKSILKDAAKAFLDPVSRERTRQQRKALKHFDFTPLLLAIRTPTLIIHGSEDAVVKPEAAEIMSRSIQGSTLQIVQGIGHLFLAETPKLFTERVSQFLEAHK